MKTLILIVTLVLVAVNPSLVKLALNTTVDVTHNVMAKSLGLVANVSVAGESRE